jgi:hypothetical protein
LTTLYIYQQVALIFGLATFLVILLIIAFNYGKDTGEQALFLKEPDGAKTPQFKLIVPKKIADKGDAAVDRYMIYETAQTEDEETKIKKLRAKIEAEKVNTFFD